MTGFIFENMFPLGEDQTEYRCLTKGLVYPEEIDGRKILSIDPNALAVLAEQAFKDVAHLYRSEHLKKLKMIIDDPESSDNDRYVALELLKNAVISAKKVYPMCQDTGTAIIMGKKGQNVRTMVDDHRELSEGVFFAYTKHYLRYSQNAPLTMYDELNTRTNLPAQIEIEAVAGNEYRFLFIAKGGGSANKTALFQMTKALLTSEEKLLAFMLEKMKGLGTTACPPYYIAFVIGGTSAEMNLKAVKLASTRYLDSLPDKGDNTAHAFRDRDLEKKALALAQQTGIGTQFGGPAFCH